MAQDLYPVPSGLRDRAHLRSMEQYQAMYRRSLEDPSGFWAEQAAALDLGLETRAPTGRNAGPSRQRLGQRLAPGELR